MVGRELVALQRAGPASISRVTTCPAADGEPSPSHAPMSRMSQRRKIGARRVEEVRERAQAVHAARRDAAEISASSAGSRVSHDAGRLHLLLRQLDLAGADVLHRAHLDLLEADDLLGHEHLALLGDAAPASPAALKRWRIHTPLALTASVK